MASSEYKMSVENIRMMVVVEGGSQYQCSVVGVIIRIAGQEYLVIRVVGQAGSGHSLVYHVLGL